VGGSNSTVLKRHSDKLVEKAQGLASNSGALGGERRQQMGHPLRSGPEDLELQRKNERKNQDNESAKDTC